jgi:hypothetical protein
LSAALDEPDDHHLNIPRYSVIDMHHVLAHLPGVKRTWTWDVSCPPVATPPHVYGTFSEPATNPPLSKVVLTCADLPYDVTVLPAMGDPSSATATVSVRDILFGIYKNLRMPLTHREYGLLSLDHQHALATAYRNRVNRIAGPTAREEEGSRGLKRIDYLIASGRTRFLGIVATDQVIDILNCTLQLKLF